MISEKELMVLNGLGNATAGDTFCCCLQGNEKELCLCKGELQDSCFQRGKRTENLES